MGATPKNKPQAGISFFKGAIILVLVAAALVVLFCQMVLFHSFHQAVELPSQPIDLEDSSAVHGMEREQVKITAGNIDFCKQAGVELNTAAAEPDALASPEIRTDVDNTPGQKMGLLVVHKAQEDVAWAARFRDFADVDVRMVTAYEDELQEFVQYIVDNYDDLPPMVGFLHGPLDDWHWLPGGGLGRWDTSLVGEGQQHPPRTRLTVDEIVQAFKYLIKDPDLFKARFVGGFLGLHDISQSRCNKEETHRLKVYLRCKWRSEPWLYRLREYFGWDDDALAAAKISCRHNGNSIVHRDIIWKHSKIYWESMLHTAETLSQENMWMWKRHVDTHKVLGGLTFWSMLMTNTLKHDYGWFGNQTFIPPGGFRTTFRTGHKKKIVDDYNRDTHLSPLPQAWTPPYSKITLAHLLRSGGSWAKEVINLGMYNCEPSGQFHRDCTKLTQEWNCTCLFPSHEASMNKWYFPINHADGNMPHFRIHVVREPCAYYVGLWRFQARYARLKHPHYQQWRCLSGDTPDSEFFPRSMRGEHAIPKFPQHAIAFRKWMKNIHHGNTLGQFMWRMWSTQRYKDWNWTNKEFILKQAADDGQRSDCSRRQSREKVREIKDAFHNIDSTFAMAHCWVSMSHMAQDLSHCIKQFDSIHPGHFNMDYIKEIEAMPQFEPTWPCEEMYDKETRDMVEFRDGLISKRFGFQCCKSHGFHEKLSH
mmetsp:Transcript_88420/g.166625  ORF Transcript_88420/g.166625 Transcript_88420/m.166625 type:complete len:704 (+) Transcript_88420:194-2305(+)